MSGRRTTIKAHVAPYYFQGEDAYFTFEHYVAGALTNATAAPTITIDAPTKAALFSAQNTSYNATVGCYKYECVIPSNAVCGFYKYQLSAVYDSITNLGCWGVFEVKEKV